MTLRCKFSPLGKPEIDSYNPGTILYEASSPNDTFITANVPILHGVYELMCCSGGGGQWCYIGCNQGSAGSFFKGVVYFAEDQVLEIQVGGGASTHAHNAYHTSIANCIFCKGGLSANSGCPGNSPAPTLMDGMQVVSIEINAGGWCGGWSLFPDSNFGAISHPGYLKLTYLRIEP